MKASLLFLATVVSVASIAAVDAAPRTAAAPPTDPVNINRCNVNLWPGFSATPCRPPPGVTTYGQCQDTVMKTGWTAAEARWYCSSVHFKT